MSAKVKILTAAPDVMKAWTGASLMDFSSRPRIPGRRASIAPAKGSARLIPKALARMSPPCRSLKAG